MKTIATILVATLSGCTMSQFKCFMAYGPTSQPTTEIISINGQPNVVTRDKPVKMSGPSGSWASECPHVHLSEMLRPNMSADETSRVLSEHKQWKIDNGWESASTENK